MRGSFLSEKPSKVDAEEFGRYQNEKGIKRIEFSRRPEFLYENRFKGRVISAH